jgi:hypothetical protein
MKTAGLFKNHSTQFKECKKAGLTITGKQITEIAVRYYKDGRCYQGPLEITSHEILCGRFGGVCSNQHPDCKKLRNSF